MSEDNAKTSEKIDDGSLKVSDRTKFLSAMVLMGVSFWVQPFIYFRSQAYQTNQRTSSGVEITRKEYGWFSSFLDKVKFKVSYTERDNTLTLRRTDFIKSSENYFDQGNDGIVESAILGNVHYTRQGNEKLFEDTIDPRFKEFKQRLNADQIIAEKMKSQPTIEELLR